MEKFYLKKCRKKSFTLMEMIVVLIVVGILATLGLPAYRNVIEDSKAKVCQANLDALNTALGIYGMEHDTMPGSLSELPWEYIQRGYAQVLQKKGTWKIELAYFLINLNKQKLAYATSAIDPLFLKNNLAKGNPQVLICPAQSESELAAHGYVSYGINEEILSKTGHPIEFKDIPDDTVMIADCSQDDFTFSNANQIEARHNHYGVLGDRKNYALGVVKKLIPVGDLVPVTLKESNTINVKRYNKSNKVFEYEKH